MEQTFLFQINREWTGPFLDRVMAVASSWDFWWPILAVAGVLLLIFGGFRGRAMLLCCGLAIFFVDALAVRNAKKVVDRARPHMVLEGVRQVDLARAKPRILAIAKPLEVRISPGAIAPVGGGSFPSGHAANNFAIATVVFVFFRRWGWLAFFPAALVAYSRVYVGSHWPTDVVLSPLLAIGVTLLMLAVAEFSWRRWSRRVFPKLSETHPSLFSE